LAETRGKKTETKDDELRDMLNEISERRCSFIPERFSAAEARDRLKAAFAAQACFLPGRI